MVMKFGAIGEVSTILEKEFNILRSVEHENIVRALTWHECALDAGFTMSYCSGPTLKQFLKIASPDPIARRVQIGKQVASTVAFLHMQRILHRDLHTGNLIIHSDCPVEENVKVTLIDFGSATSEDGSSGNDVEDKLRKSQSQSSLFASKSSLFAGENTLPVILPPENSPYGSGSAAKRDVFAVGLLIAGLVRWKNTETADMYKDLELQRSWWKPSPPACAELADVVLGLLALDPRNRLKVEDALHQLPPPGSWFQSNCEDSEVLSI